MDEKISQLSFNNPLTGSEILPIVQSGTNRKLRVSDIAPASIVLSVNGHIGVVNLNYADVSAVGIGTGISQLTNDVGYIIGNQPITLSGDATGTGATSISVVLANSGVGAGTYTKVTVDAKGRVTVGTTLVASDIPNLDFSKITTGKPTTLSGYGITDAQPLDGDLTSIAGLAGTSGYAKKTGTNTWVLDTNTYLTGNQTITLSGDISGSGATAIATTIGSNKVLDTMIRQSAGLSILGRSANTTGNVSDITAVTNGHVLRYNGTSVGFGTITGASLVLNNGVGTLWNNGTGTLDIDPAYQSTITNLGTIVSGTWNADVIDVAYGGTGFASPQGANTLLGVNSGNTAYEFKSFTNGITHIAGSIRLGGAISNSIVWTLNASQQLSLSGLNFIRSSGTSQSITTTYGSFPGGITISCNGALPPNGPVTSLSLGTGNATMTGAHGNGTTGSLLVASTNLSVDGFRNNFQISFSSDTNSYPSSLNSNSQGIFILGKFVSNNLSSIGTGFGHSTQYQLHNRGNVVTTVSTQDTIYSDATINSESISYIHKMYKSGSLSNALTIKAATSMEFGVYGPLLLANNSSDYSGVNGYLYYNTSLNTFKGYINSQWDTFGMLAATQTFTNKILVGVKLETSSVSGQVWTATDTIGSGHWATANVGTVTSISGSGGTTGLTLNGGPITGSGTLTLGGILAIANGGTGTATPGLIAGTNVTITGAWPNQTINASGGGGGITNGAANNELTKSNGTNVVSSKIFVTTLGNLTLGDGSTAGDRIISVTSSTTNANLTISPQGTGGVTIGGAITLSTALANDNALTHIMAIDPVTGIVKYRLASNLVPAGFTNAAANGELILSDGTNGISSKLFSSSANLTLGDGTLSGSRAITVASSDTDAGLSFTTKGIGYIQANANSIRLYNTTGNSDIVISNAVGAQNISAFKTTVDGNFSIVASLGSSTNNDGDSLLLSAGNAYASSGNGNGGSVTIQAGGHHGSGGDGNILLNPLTGAVLLKNTTTSFSIGMGSLYAGMFVNDVSGGGTNNAFQFKTSNNQLVKLYTVNAGTNYAITNVTTDRTYDANSTSLDEIADVLGTLVADLKLTGLIS